MGRKSGGRGRSTSAGNYAELPSSLSPPATMSPSRTGDDRNALAIQNSLTSCSKLFDMVLNFNGKECTNFLHKIAMSRSHQDLDPQDLTLADKLLQRSQQLDVLSQKNNESCHTRKFLLMRDAESGYTPLHSSLLHGKLRLALLLLRHAVHSNAVRINSSALDVVMKKTHPILLLEGMMSGLVESSHGIADGDILSDVVRATDDEGFTPFELMCQSLSLGLRRCRNFIVNETSHQIRTGRDRGFSIESYDGEEDANHNSGGGSNQSVSSVARQRSSSFSSIGAYGWGHNNNEFSALGEMLPGEGTSDFDTKGTWPGHYKQELYGCEVLTFGEADHCALGVPQFSSRREDGKAANKNGNNVGSDTRAKASTRPRRVEAFALGEMGRRLGNKSNNGSAHNSHHGSAVAVSAAAHHTLVATRNGHLFAFGLGKGGRLGTGDECHRPLPTRVLGPLARRKVVAISAAINHSLCVTADGCAFAWGSNRFGQLGSSSSGEGSSGSKSGKKRNLSSSASASPEVPPSKNQTAFCCTPRRVEDLKQVFVVSVAAGDRHSVALTRRGEVYTWGDNRAGQLGMNLRGQSSQSFSKDSVRGCCHKASRVDALWLATPRRVAVSIEASEHSTLTLTLPPRTEEMCGKASLPVNAVYGWGHGNHTPIKVNFPIPKSCEAQRTYYPAVNPVGIACAKFHNVAITSRGWVYSWGLHSEPLGTPKSPLAEEDSSSFDATGQTADNNAWESYDPSRKHRGGRSAGASSSSSSMVIASPRLVEGMLPENGGGSAVAVSASENHTAVLTDCGHLFTWGATNENGVLGHQGVKWQPVPKRVPGVRRAVGLSAAREHTVLLVGTSLPQLPHIPAASLSLSLDACPASPGLLELLTARTTAKYVDLYNVLPILIMAERIQCHALIEFCTSFIRLNLDGVLASAKRKDLDTLLDESMVGGAERLAGNEERDSMHHPILFHLATAGDECEKDGRWFAECAKLLETLPPATVAKYLVSNVPRRDAVPPFNQNYKRPFAQDSNHRGERSSSVKEQRENPSGIACSEKCRSLTSAAVPMTPQALQAKCTRITKEIRSAKKKLSQIEELEKYTSSSSKPKEDAESLLTPEQHEKLARKPMLEADLAVLIPFMERISKEIELMENSAVNPAAVTTILKEDPKEEKHIDEKEEKHIDEKEEKRTDQKEEADPIQNLKVRVDPSEEVKGATRFKCEICNVTCPDEASFALHRSGRKHRNRIFQVENEEKEKAAANMMKHKKKQQMMQDLAGKLCGEAKPAADPQPMSKQAWKTGAEPESVRPRYKLYPPPTFEPMGVSNNTKTPPQLKKIASAPWTMMSTPKKKEGSSSNFQKILEEEERALSSKKVGSPVAQIPLKSIALHATQDAMKLPAASAKPHALAGLKSSNAKSTVPLAAFLSPTRSATRSIEKQSAMASGDTTSAKKGSSPVWGQKTRNEPKAAEETVQTQQAQHTKSFQDIQQEEVNFQAKQDPIYASAEGKWYVERRERADSLGAIQAREEKAKEFRLFVEEQKQIEEQIARDLRKEEEEEKNKKKKKQKKKKERQGDGGDGDGGDGGDGRRHSRKQRQRQQQTRSRRQGRDHTKTKDATEADHHVAPMAVESLL